MKNDQTFWKRKIPKMGTSQITENQPRYKKKIAAIPQKDLGKHQKGDGGKEPCLRKIPTLCKTHLTSVTKKTQKSPQGKGKGPGSQNHLIKDLLGEKKTFRTSGLKI